MQAKDIEESLQSIQQQIVAKNYSEALVMLERFQQLQPEHVEGLYMQAVCQRYQGELELALQTLQRLKRLSPEHGRAFQEEGHTLRRLNRPQDALQAYLRATDLNPALKASWTAQIEIANALGQPQLAARANAQLNELNALPPALVAVKDLIAQGKLVKAEDIARQFLQKAPHHVEAMRLLADVGIRLAVYEDAELLLKGATALQPDNDQIRIEYIQALRKRQKFAEASEQAHILLQKAPENPQYQSIFAVDCMHTGKFDEALEHFDKVLAQLPNDSLTWTSKGHALKTRGDSDAAVSAYKKAAEANPSYGEAYYSLANLKTFRFDQQDTRTMEERVSDANLPFMDRVYFNFALGKAYEDAKDYDLSFKYYQQGNELKRARSQYNRERMSEDLRAQQQACKEELFASHRDTGCPAPDPIFILGLPRAGSTLLEQILSSHSQVDGTLELPNILALSQRLRRRAKQSDAQAYPAILNELDSTELQQMGEEFIRDTQIHRKGASRFIDKMPNNFRHIGLIKLILPNAKIIDARRNAMDCCFSGYKQLFAEGQEFSYSLEDIGQYYRDYVDLMDHWDRVLPGFVLRVNNEDVIDDLEGQVSRMLDFCQLPFEENCLRYYETDRDIRTPSSEQVRKPVNRSGVGKWRAYQKHLGPLIDALGPELAGKI